MSNFISESFRAVRKISTLKSFSICSVFFLTKKAGSSDSCFRSPCLDISFSRKNVPSNVHGGYQYCQAGMSVDWAKNGDKNEVKEKRYMLYEIYDFDIRYGACSIKHDTCDIKYVTCHLKYKKMLHITRNM